MKVVGLDLAAFSRGTVPAEPQARRGPGPKK
jgi:hypothetical protein